MNLEEWISDHHGMELDPVAQPDHRSNENGILFLVHYYIFKYIDGTLTDKDILRFQIIVENLTAYDKDGNRVRGLYDRGAGESLSLNKEMIRKISHDNLTAISALSRLLENRGLSYHKDIAIHGVKWQMRYDNAYPDSPKFLRKNKNPGLKGKWDMPFQWHPANWFFWLTNGGYKSAWILFPIFFFANVISCLGDETSGKWLVFAKLETGSKWSKAMALNKKICYAILRKKYGNNFIDKIAEIYFHQHVDSPIRLMTKNRELY